MDFFDIAKRVAGGLLSEVAKNTSVDSSRQSGKLVAQWDNEWICIGPLKLTNLTSYNHCVGLYRHVVNGKTLYVGRAIELHNGGFRKRLSDHRRESNSARKHLSGRTIHEHLDEIVTYILIVGGTEEAVLEKKTGRTVHCLLRLF
ncbi:hypothetical protein [Peptostreptococcus stomatis]